MLLKNILILASIVVQPTLGAPASSENQLAEKSYKGTVLAHHNIHRKNHSAPSIRWSRKMVQSAHILAESCIWGHNTSIKGGGYGQNIAAGVARSQIATVITNLFYNSEMANFQGQYGKATPNFDNFGSWGHFTQVVWKGSKQVGCATSNCPHGMRDQVTGQKLPYDAFTVCNYYPPGNYYGEFDKNVGRPKGMRTVVAH